MTGATILVVDDELDLLETIKFNLERTHYRVLDARDGQAALEIARKEHPDLIILDLMLPRMSGQEVTVALKGDDATRHIPIVMLTARSEESDIVVGLQLGADDYVTKPFSIQVLLARVAAVLRRRASRTEAVEVLKAGPVTIDRGRHIVTIDEQTVPMTLTEFRLLEALVMARARVLSRDRLMERVMGPDVAVTDRTIDVHVTSLRRKLGAHRDLVETVRGVGYRFADVWHGREIGC
jgi:two-component system phosphate regulon response regulator PhoB